MVMHCGSGPGNIDVDTRRASFGGAQFPPMPVTLSPGEQTPYRTPATLPPQPPPPAVQRPSVGRIVHYHCDRYEPYAALVTSTAGADGDYIEIYVFDASNPRYTAAWPRTNERSVGWSWPPRV